MERRHASVEGWFTAILGVLIVGLSVGVSGCSTGRSGDGLKFSENVTQDPQLSRVMARFCDSAYIAVNQSEELTPLDVMERYRAIQAKRTDWKSPIQIAELTKASLISGKGPREVADVFDSLQDKLEGKISPVQIADLAKIAIVTDHSASDLASAFKTIAGNREWKDISAAVELAKMSVFTDRTAAEMLAIFDEFQLRNGMAVGKDRQFAELAKISALTGRTPNDVIRLYDSVDQLNHGYFDAAGLSELTKIAALTNSTAKKAYYRYTEIVGKKSHWQDRAQVWELTKLSMLGSRTASDVVKKYDVLSAIERSEGGAKADAGSLTYSLITGETLQDSVNGNNVDECGGGYARLVLSVDAYGSWGKQALPSTTVSKPSLAQNW